MAKYIRKHPCGHQGRGKHCHRCESAGAIRAQLDSLTKEAREKLGKDGVSQLEHEELRLRATRGSIPTWAEREKAQAIATATVNGVPPGVRSVEENGNG